MAGWSESGLYVATMIQALTAATAPNWTLSTNKFFLTSNSDTPDYTQVAASAIYSATNEVTGTNWPATGITAATLGAGSSNLSLALTGTGTKIVSWTANNVSVATTTIATATYGGYFYVDSLSPKAKIIGIYFGGSGYTTVSGTFAITWSGGVIATITCAA